MSTTNVLTVKIEGDEVLDTVQAMLAKMTQDIVKTIRADLCEAERLGIGYAKLLDSQRNGAAELRRKYMSEIQPITPPIVAGVADSGCGYSGPDRSPFADWLRSSGLDLQKFAEPKSDCPNPNPPGSG